MSMLAERKKREKWALNPRGKLWSEDQNKFGQRLMEKMGWKTGQGLGANSQGQTDIVKTRVKNDSKGLGFKDNGEEWLKTTSDFDNLLEELASSQEDSGDGSQSEAPASLEDRSKKSRARVHYHKFTRGKDLSRYSEKDLASIIGPEVIKLKSKKETKSDYTQNQVNKGSIQDYFNKKKEQVEKKLTYDENNGEIADNSGEIVMGDECEKKVFELESAGFLPKKKKRKREVDGNLAEVNSSTVSDSCKLDNDQLDLEIQPSRKIKRNKKSNRDNQNDSQDIGENGPDLSNLVSSEISLEKTEELTNRGKTSKKRKTCNGMDSVVIDDMQYPCESNEDGKTPKKKKMKSVKTDEQATYDQSSNCDSSFVQSAENEVVSKKEKKRTKLELEHDVNPVVDDEKPVCNEELVPKKKKKKSKEKCVELVTDHYEEEIEKDSKLKDNNSSDAEEEERTHDNIPKRKKKNVVEEKNGEELIVMEQKHTKDKQPGKEISVNSQGASNCEQETNDDSQKLSEDLLEVCGRRTRLRKLKPVCKTTNNPYKTADFISLGETDNSKKETSEEHSSLPLKNDMDTEKIIVHCKSNPSDVYCPQKVIWFENKLVKKKLIKHTESKLFKRKLSEYAVQKKPCITIVDSQHLSSPVVKKLKEIHTIRYYKSFLTDQERSEIDAAVKKYRESLKTSGDAVPKDVNQNREKFNSVQEEIPKNTTDCQTSEDFQSTETKEVDILSSKETQEIRCLIEGKPDDCNLPKHVVAFEYRQVVARLKQLDITPPELKVAVKDSSELGYNTCRKLKQIAKITHLKKFLSPEDLSEIETLVSKFHDSLKPKIEIMEIFTQLDEKKLEITRSLNKNNESGLEEVVAIKKLWAENSGVMTDLFKKLETCINNFRKTQEKNSTSAKSVKEKFGQESAESKNESSCEEIKWLKKVENYLDIWKKHMEMLSRGEIPPDLIESQKEEKNKVTNNQLQSDERKNLWNAKYSKVNNRGARARGFGWVDSRVAGFGRGFSERHAETSGVWTAQGYSRGNQSYRGGFDRGRGRGRGRGFSEGGDVGVLETNGPCAPQGFTRGGQSYRGGFDRGRGRGGRGFSEGGDVGVPETNGPWAPQGFTRGIQSYRGGFGGFPGRGRGLNSSGSALPSGGWGYLGTNGSWTEHGHTRASFNYRREFYGRGFSSRGFTSRGTGRGDMRGRGRISQNNFEAKIYAEKCKELNKVPEICFNGVDMKFISGYAANVSVDKNILTDPSSVNSQANQTLVSGINSTKGKDAEKIVQGNFSEVVINKES